jgi:hypothetical protein
VGPPFSVQDSSAGAGAVNADSPYFAAGGPSFTSTGYATTYSGARYIEMQFNNPLPGNIAVTGATFNTVATTPSGTMCAYIQTRTASTSAVLANYGSPAADLGCFTGSVTYALPLGEMTSTGIANDFALRVYATSTTSAGIGFDQASITVTTPYQTAVLYPVKMIDSADSTPATIPWSLNSAADGSFYTSTGWSNAYVAARRVDYLFPAYTPAGTTVTGATITHTYRDSNGNKAFYYVEIWSGGVLIATKGSSAAPFSFDGLGGPAFFTDVIAVPEINTVARANAVTVRMFAWSNGAARDIQQDRLTLGVDYYLN